MLHIIVVTDDLNSLSKPLQHGYFTTIVGILPAVRLGFRLSQFNVGRYSDGQDSGCVIDHCLKFIFVLTCLLITKLVTDGRSSILLLSKMFCHG